MTVEYAAPLALPQLASEIAIQLLSRLAQKFLMGTIEQIVEIVHFDI